MTLLLGKRKWGIFLKFENCHLDLLSWQARDYRIMWSRFWSLQSCNIEFYKPFLKQALTELTEMFLRLPSAYRTSGVSKNRDWPLKWKSLTEFWRTLRVLCIFWFLVKFIYSEKATKFCEIFTLLLSYIVPVKSKVKISQNSVAFSEYMNFICTKYFKSLNHCEFWIGVLPQILLLHRTVVVFECRVFSKEGSNTAIYIIL